MEVIVPAAGLSTRFPNMRPKYTLTDYSSNMMFESAIMPLIGVYPITIGVLKENEDQYAISEYVSAKYGTAVKVLVLENRTAGPADTVFQIIQKSGMDRSQEILVKDCDSFFHHQYYPGNYVCVSSITHHENLKKISNKSYVVVDSRGIEIGRAHV